jgi:hypothetical protein
MSGDPMSEKGIRTSVAFFIFVPKPQPGALRRLPGLGRPCSWLLPMGLGPTVQEKQNAVRPREP